MWKKIIPIFLLVAVFSAMFAAPHLINHRRENLYKSASETLDTVNEAVAASKNETKAQEILQVASVETDPYKRKALIKQSAELVNVKVKDVSPEKLEKLKTELAELQIADLPTDLKKQEKVLKEMLEMSYIIAYNEN